MLLHENRALVTIFVLNNDFDFFFIEQHYYLILLYSMLILI